MKIAIIGAGRIGSTFAFHLSRGGHDVTLIARGARLEALQKDGAIIAVNGDRAVVKAANALDTTVAFDLVLVTVLAHQVDALLPSLTASAAKSVMFMFNTFEKIERLRDVVGASRFAFAFPAMTAFLVEGKLKSTVKGPGLVTTLNSDAWARVFAAAGLPTEVEPDMDSFLRSHVAFVVPVMAASCLMYKRRSSLTWAEAKTFASALAEALGLVRSLGHKLTPSIVSMMARLPSPLLTALLWLVSRSAGVRDLGEFGPTEARNLIDAMTAAAPGRTPRLLAIRP